jgi:hypothetical protein
MSKEQVQYTDNEFLNDLIAELIIKSKKLEKQVKRRENDIGVVSIKWDMKTGEMLGRLKSYRYIVKRLKGS